MPAESIDKRLVAAGLPQLPRRVWLEIDESALANNVAVFREMVGADVELSAVVKADAYGHGLVPVARAFEAAGVDRLCVASIDEGLILREAGIETNILSLFATTAEGLRSAARHSIQVSITDEGSLAELVRLNASADDSVGTEVEVETGLTRGGFKPNGIPEVMRSIRTSGRGLGPFALWTHIATPENEAATTAQVRAFERAVALASEAGELAGLTRHVAATGALFSGWVPTYEGVRVGLGLYGLLPADLPIAPERQHFADRLRPAMALKCRPLRIDTFPAGTAVSYGGRWVAERASVIATLPVGYGDGWSRSSTPGTYTLVHGRRVSLVGVVAMDAVMADVTDIADVSVHDEFVLIGSQGDEIITANEVARARNTIAWEVVTSMSFRVPRVYHAGSVLMGIRTLAGEVRGSAVEAMA